MKRYRPNTGREALDSLKLNKEIEVKNSHAFEVAKILEEHAGFSFSFKKSLWNKGWSGFKKI